MAIRSGAVIKPEISEFVVDYIVKKEIGIDYDGGMILQSAIEAENIPMVSLCLRSGANPNLVSSGGRTPLETAVSLGWNDDRRSRPKNIEADARSEAIIDLLIDNGADLGQKGITCKATTFRSLDLIKKFVARGGSVNDRDEKGNSPLFFCADSLAVARYLISQGADVNARNVNGDTPLMAMAKSFKLDIRVMRLVIKSGATLDAQNSFGWTALMFAASAGRKAAMEELVKLGADRSSLKSNLGKSALDLAEESVFRDASVVELLKK